MRRRPECESSEAAERQRQLHTDRPAGVALDELLQRLGNLPTFCAGPPRQLLGNLFGSVSHGCDLQGWAEKGEQSDNVPRKVAPSAGAARGPGEFTLEYEAEVELYATHADPETVPEWPVHALPFRYERPRLVGTTAGHQGLASATP